MLRTRFGVIILILALASAALIGCSPAGDAADESGSGQSNNPLVGTWENPDANAYVGLTFEADGTGSTTGVDGDDVPMSWTLEGDSLEVAIDAPNRSATSSGSFAWVEEGSKFTWDIEGTYTRVE